MKITIPAKHTDGNGKINIAVSGDASEEIDVSRILKAHGYDPDAVEYNVERGVNERISRLEKATGSGGKMRKVASPTVLTTSKTKSRLSKTISVCPEGNTVIPNPTFQKPKK